MENPVLHATNIRKNQETQFPLATKKNWALIEITALINRRIPFTFNQASKQISKVRAIVQYSGVVHGPKKRYLHIHVQKIFVKTTTNLLKILH